GAGRRVERGEELILHVDVRTRERVEEGRLAGVRVADERNLVAVAAALPLDAALAHDSLEFALQLGDPLANPTAVDFELRFARAPRSDAAAEPRQVGPQAGEARQEVLELRQLHLKARLPGTRAAREDVEDEPASVHDLDLEVVLEIAGLPRREIVVEEKERRLLRQREVPHLVHLSLAEERGGADGAPPLD